MSCLKRATDSLAGVSTANIPLLLSRVSDYGSLSGEGQQRPATLFRSQLLLRFLAVLFTMTQVVLDIIIGRPPGGDTFLTGLNAWQPSGSTARLPHSCLWLTQFVPSRAEFFRSSSMCTWPSRKVGLDLATACRRGIPS